MDNVLNFLGFITGGGAIAYVLLAIFAPSIMGVVSEYLKALTPIVKALAEAIVSYFKYLWDGFKDMVDNVGSLIFVSTLCVLSFLWGSMVFSSQQEVKQNEKKCNYAEFLNKEIRPNYRLVEKSPQEKARYRKENNLPEENSFNPFNTIKKWFE
jgi:hypothetical protein